jgi:hypothetical protein
VPRGKWRNKKKNWHCKKNDSGKSNSEEKRREDAGINLRPKTKRTAIAIRCFFKSALPLLKSGFPKMRDYTMKNEMAI